MLQRLNQTAQPGLNVLHLRLLRRIGDVGQRLVNAAAPPPAIPSNRPGSPSATAALKSPGLPAAPRIFPG
jgi:hypothetical protein